MSRLRWGIFAATLLSISVPVQADQFGDISADPSAIYTGNTFHGYAEMRVALANRSPVRKHVVTLVYPNNSFGNYGNSISRLSRTVTLAPGTREIVSLLQPPLPVQGDNSIRVEVDGRDEGQVRAPNPNSHCNYYSRGGQQATVFISRSLDFDAVGRVFQANRGAFTAAMAVGAPDVRGRSGYQASAWMPDTRRSGQANWLELDYATPQAANKIVVHNIQSPATSGSVVLIGVTGTNLAILAMSSGKNSSSGGPGWETEFSFPTTSEPVKSVRLDFGTTPPYRISIDAVQISGPSGSQWASDARASSDNSASAPSYAPGSSNPDAVESLRAEAPVSEWSADWLAYTPFDAVVLNTADLNSMPPAVLGAIGNYLLAGGNVMLFGETSPPAAWHSSKNNSLDGDTEYDAGFGHCFTFNSKNPSTVHAPFVQSLRGTVRDTARFWQSLPTDTSSANTALPIVESLKIPTRGIVFIMLLFIIAIGPVNIFVLNRCKRRTWMLWTIPAISFATTLLVFAYSLLREGITPDTRIVGLTLLDQAGHHAATIGGTAFYCPLTPSGGLHFDFETEATPLVHVGYDRAGNAREVDWTQSQHFQRGWVSARVPAYFLLRKSETRRERIQVIHENGKLQIVNSLGAPIKSLWLADASKNIFEARDIAAGQKAALTPSKLKSPLKLGPAALLRDITFAAKTNSLEPNVGDYLQPDTYIAELDGDPFIENALGSASSPKRTKSSAVVFGILENEKN
ncbi:MAG TPA: hypothetical protein VFY06_15270 [Verrucomicrobiae bacterium]|nr:hypothetical protein [Verrucomicrobiae bacterium]